MTNVSKIENKTSVGFYGLGWLLSAGAAYAIHGSLWSAFWRAWLSWAYIGYLVEKGVQQ